MAIGIAGKVGIVVSLVNSANEKVVEVFYRLQLTPEIAVTPDLQVIFDPSQNPSKDRITVIGARVRLVI